jgi:hypothetical protein
MAKSKTSLLVEKIVFLYLLLFPFGQLLSFQVLVLGRTIRLHPTDILVLLALPAALLTKVALPGLRKAILGPALLAVFSLGLSLSFFEIQQVIVGALYLLRLASYLAFFGLTSKLVIGQEKYKDILFKSLIVISLEVAVLGLIQYFFLPDLRFLYAFGWDDHLYRLVSSFLDPGFTGIILAFGAILALAAYLKTKQKRYFLGLITLIVSLLLTYSRASFLALGVGALSLFVKTRKRLILVIIAAFFLATPFLPRPEGYGVRLERTHSVVSRLANYRETYAIFKNSPIFGVGFNNICVARNEFLGDKMTQSHACSGSDSSILLVLATSGVAGLILAYWLVRRILVFLPSGFYSFCFLSCLAALFVHSQFVNSLIYPWVMGYLAILGATLLGTAKGKS